MNGIHMNTLRRRARSIGILPSEYRRMSKEELLERLGDDSEIKRLLSVPDHDGLDEWIAMAFDMLYDQSDDLLTGSEDGINSVFHGTFDQCAAKLREYALTHPDIQLRLVIERVC